MNENIQSISQGTYTIGQTSATNFVAGNGIKIDEPSAGTVRIGNDETVLWEGSANKAITTEDPNKSKHSSTKKKVIHKLRSRDKKRIEFLINDDVKEYKTISNHGALENVLYDIRKQLQSDENKEAVIDAKENCPVGAIFVDE